MKIIYKPHRDEVLKICDTRRIKYVAFISLRWINKFTGQGNNSVLNKLYRQQVSG